MQPGGMSPAILRDHARLTAEHLRFVKCAEFFDLAESRGFLLAAVQHAGAQPRGEA